MLHLPFCPERQVLPKADASIQHSLQEALSCSVRYPVLCLGIGRLKPSIPCLDTLKDSAHFWKQAVNPLIRHWNLQVNHSVMERTQDPIPNLYMHAVSNSPKLYHKSASS